MNQFLLTDVSEQARHGHSNSENRGFTYKNCKEVDGEQLLPKQNHIQSNSVARWKVILYTCKTES